MKNIPESEQGASAPVDSPLAGSLPQKPKHGEPCNGCGLCCSLELCEVAEMAFPGAQAPCPALKIDCSKGRSYCELMRIERIHGMEPMIAEGLGAGKGCSMTDDEENTPHQREQHNRGL